MVLGSRMLDRNRLSKKALIACVALPLTAFAVWSVLTMQNASRTGFIMHAFSVSIGQFAAEHNDILPDLTNISSLETQIFQYSGNPEKGKRILYRPSTNIPYITNARYSKMKTSLLPTDKEIVLVYEAMPTHGKRNVICWYSGSTKTTLVDDQRWARLKLDSGIQ